MRKRAGCCVVTLVLMAGDFAVAQQQAPPPPVTVQDCTKLKGMARKECASQQTVKAEPKSVTPAATPDDKFAFPEDASKNGGELQRGAAKAAAAGKGSATGDMPTSDVPDPPAESLKPLHPGDVGAPAGSSSSSSPAGADASTGDDDAAPTTAGGDTPVKASDLRNLGQPRGDITEARTKLEGSRVEDDLKVGRFYFKDGNLAGATARYKDALKRDPENPDAHYGLAEVLLKQNKRVEAAAELQRYLALAPDDDHTKDARKMLAKLH